MLGYLMLPGYPGKKIIVLGTARNSGKSVISRFFQRLVGPELVSGQTPFEMSESHASAEFRGKLANMALDIPATIIRPPSVSTLKAVSGGDLISTNPKGLDRRTMLCFAKQVLGTNAGLKLQQHDEAFWERVEVIPYIHTIAPEDRIYNLEDRLMDERDAIVTMCIQEARLLLLNNFRFPECDAAEQMKNVWIGWHAYAKDFLLTNCVAEKGCYRDIPVPPNLRICAIKLRDTPNKYIWEVGKPDSPCNPSYFRDKFKEEIKKIEGVRLLTPHSCRHTYVSQMQALGIDIQTIQSIVGHACTDMTEHYLHVQDSIRQNAVNRFSEVFAFSEDSSNRTAG